MPPVSTRLIYPASVSSLPILFSSSCWVRPLAFRSNTSLSRNVSPALGGMMGKQYEERRKAYRSVNVELYLLYSTFNVHSEVGNCMIGWQPSATTTNYLSGSPMNAQNSSDSSICFANCERGNRNSVHNRVIVLRVGLINPRSIKLMVVRSNLASKASLSWESPAFFRLVRKTSPNALSGPERG